MFAAKCNLSLSDVRSSLLAPGAFTSVAACISNELPGAADAEGLGGCSFMNLRSSESVKSCSDVVYLHRAFEIDIH